jgi:protein-S-isoprenylcysteine O-methyltransferase Ste14
MTADGLLPAYGALLVAFLALRAGRPRLLAASVRGALATWSLVVQLDLLVQLTQQRTPSVHLAIGLPVGAGVLAWLGLGTRRSRWPGLVCVIAGGVAIGSLRPASPAWVAVVLLSALVGAWSGIAIEEDRHRALRTLVHWTSFLGAFALVLPAALAERFGHAPAADGWTERRWLALPLIAGGTALAAWATAAFHRAGGTPEPLDPPARLCTHGPYRYVRHPLQLAEMALVWAGVLLQWSPMGAVYAAGFCAFLKGPVRWHEERVLERRFGAATRAFRDSVPAYLPRAPPRRLRPWAPARAATPRRG